MNISVDNSNQATRINLFQSQLKDQPAGKAGQRKDPWREAGTYLRSLRAAVALSAYPLIQNSSLFPYPWTRNSDSRAKYISLCEKKN